MADYDAIIIGGGHNGLVASCLLAKKGLKTLVLEKNSFVGGLASTAELFPGFKFSLGAHVYGMFRKKLAEELEMERFGLETFDAEPLFFTPFPSGRYVMWFYNNLEKTFAEIKRQFGAKDADGIQKYSEFWKAFAAGIGETFYNPPLSMGKLFSMFAGAEAEDALRKAFFYGSKDFLDELVESEEIKGAFGYWGADGFFGSPRSPGSNLFAGIHFSAGEPYRFVKGGMGGLSEALARALQHYKGTLKLSSPVKRVLIEKGKACGVELENGETITAKIVLSSLDPKNTFLQRVGADHLPESFVTGIKNIKMEPVHCQAFCALKELPDYKCLPGNKEPGPQHKTAFMVAAPSMEYVERTWDDAKFGRPSEKPTVIMSIPTVYNTEMAPPGMHAASLYIQYAPYDLKEGTWETEKEKMADRAVDIITEYAPNFKDSIVQRKVFSPPDYEKLFGATRGNFCHGDPCLSQLFSFRPLPGWSQYKTPVENLYLCGAGAHPGGGVTGAPGHNAAQVVLGDWERGK